MPKSKIADPDLDFYGKLLSAEQAMKSLEGRLRGIEYRLSFDDQKTMQAIEKKQGADSELKQFLNLVEGKVFALEARIKELDILHKKLEEAKAELKEIKARNAELEKNILEMQTQMHGKKNNPRPFSIKIPVDITGIVAAACMLIIAVLLATNNSEILREPAFSMTMGVAFILAVAGKRFMTQGGTGTVRVK